MADETPRFVCLRTSSEDDMDHSLSWSTENLYESSKCRGTVCDIQLADIRILRENDESKSFDYKIYRKNSVAIGAVLSEQVLYRLRRMIFKMILE